MKRALKLAFIVSTLFGVSVPVGLTWNDAGDRLFVAKAIDGLPKPLKRFYENRESVILESLSNPARGSRAIFEVDQLETFPFEDIPESRELAIQRYGEEKLQEVGDAPWKLIETYEQLVEAFRASKSEEAKRGSVASTNRSRENFKKIVELSADVAYYTGELYVPPNVSMLGDGQPTGQQGLRERFSSRLMEVYADKIDVNKASALFLDRPDEYAVSIAIKSYIWVDNLLYHDVMARRGVSSYDRFSYESLYIRLKPLLEELLSGAALDTASFWYTAWVDARKPELPKK